MTAIVAGALRLELVLLGPDLPLYGLFRGDVRVGEVRPHVLRSAGWVATEVPHSDQAVAVVAPDLEDAAQELAEQIAGRETWEAW